MSKKTVSLLILLISLILLGGNTVHALPDSGTEKSGNPCEQGHDFNYEYNFFYDNNMRINHEYKLFISPEIDKYFSERHKTKFVIKIEPRGIKVSDNNLSFTSKQENITIVPLENKPSLYIEGLWDKISWLSSGWEFFLIGVCSIVSLSCNRRFL
ncbi:hypothetical protein AKJ50_01895, partial [candidate division MSBL1 archaeon SCGC-AAA382A13]